MATITFEIPDEILVTEDGEPLEWTGEYRYALDGEYGYDPIDEDITLFAMETSNKYFILRKKPKPKRDITAEELIERGALYLVCPDTRYTITEIDSRGIGVTAWSEKLTILQLKEKQWQWSPNGIDWYSFQVEGE